MSLYKIFKILVIVLGVIGFGFFIFIQIRGDEEVASTGAGVDWFIFISYITLFLAISLVGIFVIREILKGNIMKTIIPIIAFVVIIGISFLLADGNETIANDGTVISATQSRWIGAGLYTFYIVALIALGSMVFSGFKKVTR